MNILLIHVTYYYYYYFCKRDHTDLCLESAESTINVHTVILMLLLDFCAESVLREDGPPATAAEHHPGHVPRDHVDQWLWGGGAAVRLEWPEHQHRPEAGGLLCKLAPPGCRREALAWEGPEMGMNGLANLNQLLIIQPLLKWSWRAIPFWEPFWDFRGAMRCVTSWKPVDRVRRRRSDIPECV